MYTGGVLQAALKSRSVRSWFQRAISTWQYAARGNEPMYELGLSAWRSVVSRAPVREHLVLVDPSARSPLRLPVDSRALVTSVGEAQLEYFDDVVGEARALAAGPDIDAVFAAMIRDRDRYDFRLHLNPKDVGDPRNATFVKFALQPRIAGLAREYLKVPCQLSEVTVMLDRSTTDPPRESQNWHRDPDDWTTLSVFVYLSDVGTDTAPFCYVPFQESRRLYGKVGKFRRFQTWHVIPDEMMEQTVPRERWLEVTGPTGTVTFIDSASCYHRGKRAVSARRLSLHLIFTSTLSRMEMNHPWKRLLARESERRYASESPRHMVASALPRAGP
jgi:hypothetical protein